MRVLRDRSVCNATDYLSAVVLSYLGQNAESVASDIFWRNWVFLHEVEENTIIQSLEQELSEYLA